MRSEGAPLKSFEPKYFEPGTLVRLDPRWYHASPEAIGLIIERANRPDPCAVYGSQYVHTVLVGEKLYEVYRSTIIGAYNND